VFGALKENVEFIKVTRALNSLDMGVVPYEYKYRKKTFSNSNFKGFTDITTRNIIYINTNIPEKSIQRVAFREFLHIVKYFYNDLYKTLSDNLNRDKSYIIFRDSPLNKKALEDCKCPLDEHENES